MVDATSVAHFTSSCAASHNISQMTLRSLALAGASLAALISACTSSETAARVRQNTIILEQLYGTHEAATYPLSPTSSLLVSSENIGCVTVTLGTVIQAALSNNPLIAVAEHYIEMARADAWRAMSYYFPRGKLSGSFTYFSEQTIQDVQFDVSQAAGPVNELIRGYNAAIDRLRILFPDLQPISARVPQEIVTDVRIEPHTDVRGTLRIVQPLFVGGQIYYRHRQAKTGEVLAHNKLRQAQHNVAHDAVLTYFLWNHLAHVRSVLADAHGRVLAIERLADHRRQLVDPTDTGEAKIATEYWRARAFRLMLEERQARTEDALRSTEFALRALMGYPAFTPIVPTAFDFLSLTNTTALVHAAAHHRPTTNLKIRELELMVRAAKQGRMATQGALWPQVYGFFQYDTVDVVDYQSGDEGSWFIGIGLNLPVFDLLENIAKLRRADAEVRATRAALAAGLLKTEAEIRSLANRLAAAYQRRLLLAAALTAINNRITTARELRQIGYDSIKEMLDAQYEKLQVDLQHADLLHEEAQTVLNLAEFFPDTFALYLNQLSQ
ncbi:MAG: TolC family protein [bacterium]|nr:TolC family protein [bacterium]